MLIPYVAQLEPDECLFSLVARTIRLSSLRQSKGLLALWFGDEYAVLSTDIPARLSNFQAAWGDSFCWHEVGVLLEETTVWPYHRPFLTPTKAATVEALMRAGSVKGLKTYVGRVANGFGASPALRYCAWCAQDDARRSGLPFWRRAHQLPGVQVCQEHGIALLQQETALSPDLPALTLTLPLDTVPVKTCTVGKRSWQLARLSAELLSSALPALPPKSLAQAYRAGLRDAGFSSEKRSIRFAKLARALGEHHDSFSGYEHQRRLLSSANAPLRWLQALVHRSSSSSHPICHCLLIDFLFGSVRTFMAAVARENKPERLRSERAAIESIDLERHKSETFKKAGVEEVAKSLPNVSVPFNEQWWLQPSDAQNDGLLEDLHLGIGPSEAAQRNNASLSAAYRAIPSRDFLQTRERGESLIRRRAYQAQWIHCFKMAEGNVNRARRQASRQYAWLYRDDLTWLRSCNAWEASSIKRPPPRRQVVDWPRRDSELEKRLALVVALIDYQNVRRRVSTSLLLRAIDYETQYRHMRNSLPRLSRLLRDSTQSVIDFQLMRIASAISDLRTLGVPVTCQHRSKSDPPSSPTPK